MVLLSGSIQCQRISLIEKKQMMKLVKHKGTMEEISQLSVTVSRLR
jgi:hypothetical protein